MSCLVSSWMISHLGRNPVNGGRPARESRVSRSIALSDGILAHVVIRTDSLSTFIEFRVRNTAVVIRMYK